MKQVDKINVKDLQQMAEKMYGQIVKADVDVAKKIMVLDAEMHADIEAFMLEQGSRQEDLWGINLHPDDFGTDNFIEFDSMINIRPKQGNRSRYVDDKKTRQQIVDIVQGAVYE
jgi:hypothetical protein